MIPNLASVDYLTMDDLDKYTTTLGSFQHRQYPRTEPSIHENFRASDMEKIKELKDQETYSAFLKDAGWKMTIPALDDYRAGTVNVFRAKGDEYRERSVQCSIQVHPNCCGAKLLHSATEGKKDVRYAIGAALLWCKLSQNSSATYIVSNQQPSIKDALESFNFKFVQRVSNPKSGNYFSTYIINPREL